MFVEATGGKDANDGSAESPVATVKRANQIISNARTADPEIDGATVIIGEGQYFLDWQINVSGEKYNNVTYTAKEGTSPEFIGGVAVKVGDTFKVTDTAILDRLVDQSVRDNLYYFDLGAKLGGKNKIRGIGLPGAYTKQFALANYVTEPLATHELFYKKASGEEEEVMTLSRYPNEGYARITEVVHEGAKPRYWEDDAVTKPDYVQPEDRDITDSFIIKFDDSHVSKWGKADQAAMFGYWYFDWATQAVTVSGIDPQARTIKSKYPSVYGVLPNQKFYVYNLLEEIDIVNEYFIDRSTGLVYYYKSPTAKATDEIYVSNVSGSPLLLLKDVKNVKVKGLTFTTTMNAGITAINTENVVIDNCKILNTSSYAANISGGKNNTIKNSYIANCDGGVNVSGGETETLTPANNTVYNNEFVNFSRISKAYRPAVIINGVGNKAMNNEIHYSEHNAIMFGGNNHEISYNEIYDVCREASDAGAIYAGRSWVDRGTEVKYNYIHDIKTIFTENASYASGIFLDDTYSGTHIYGNILVDMPELGIQLNGGRDNEVYNNIFVNCNEMYLWNGMPTEFYDEDDIKTTSHYKSLLSSPYQTDIWKREYPTLYTILDNHPELPIGCKMINNLSVKSGAGRITSAAITNNATVENNYATNEDPGFVDMANKNYQLKADSVVFTQIPGFKNIDFSKIGRKAN